tara:strand:+ start:11544 stop:12515 length:972 start_codon:yes stop_codon:yes gene_type:complete
VNFKKSVVCYAEGSNKIGMGHLYRQLSFYQNYSHLIDIKFIAKNNIQKDFYKTFDCKYIDISQVDDLEEFDFGIFDSKEDLIDIFSRIKFLSKTWIAIDSTKKWVKEFDYAIFPSFFSSLETIPKELHKFNIKLLFGIEYVLTRATHERDNVNIDFKTLVTFGGTDPNNLTELLANIVTKRLDRKDFIFLIGPYFKRNKIYFENKFNKLNFLSPVNSTRNLINKSNCVITSLGTTLQECEFFSKNTILITNYLSDEDDAQQLNKHSINNGIFYHLGHFSNINENDFNKIYNKYSKNYNYAYNCKNYVSSTWGAGWDNLLEINK